MALGFHTPTAGPLRGPGPPSPQDRLPGKVSWPALSSAAPGTATPIFSRRLPGTQRWPDPYPPYRCPPPAARHLTSRPPPQPSPPRPWRRLTARDVVFPPPPPPPGGAAGSQRGLCPAPAFPRPAPEAFLGDGRPGPAAARRAAAAAERALLWSTSAPPRYPRPGLPPPGGAPLRDRRRGGKWRAG